MRFPKLILAPFILLFLSLMSFQDLYSQITTKIKFAGDKKQVKQTKKLLGKYDIYFIFNNEEIKVKYTNDSLLVIENIGDKQIKQFKNQEFILIKFHNKKRCLYSLLPNGFFYYNHIQSLMIYESTTGCEFFWGEHKRYVLNFTHNYKGGGRNVPLTLIPCSEYKGEYDKGLESFLESLKN